MNKKVLELRDKRGVILDKVDEVRAKAKNEKGEARNFTKEERDEIDGLLAQVEDLNEQIASAEVEARAEAAKLDAELRTIPGPRALPVESRKNYNQWPVDEGDQFLRAVIGMGKKVAEMPSNIHEDYRTFFENPTRAITGLGTIVDNEGGFLVPETISSTILQKSHSEGQLLSRCQPVPITVGNSTKWNAVTENSRASGSRYGGITVGRVAEGGQISGTKPKTERVALELKKTAALVYLTDELMEDGPQMRTLTESLVPKAITFSTEEEIIHGLGGTQMEGILNTPSLIEVSKETGQAAATVLFENITKMWSRLDVNSRNNAVWFINQDVEPALDFLALPVGTGGIPVYMPANGVADTPFGRLKGRPVVSIEHCQTLGTVGDILLLDLSQYLLASKGGVKVAESMHVRFEYMEQALRYSVRNDGKSWWPAAMTPARGSNTVSPFVALATRA